jgi:hypothetical protein
MAKCLHNIGSNEIEELVFNSDSEVQFASDNTDNDFMHDFS